MATGFKKGRSGNPAGRPKGIQDKRTILRELLDPHAAKLVSKVVDLALAGDTKALRICIDRLIPPLREDRLTIELPGIGDSVGCAAAQAKIVAAVAGGDLLPGEGERLSSMVENQRRSIESEDFTKRLAAIEEKLNVGRSS